MLVLGEILAESDDDGLLLPEGDIDADGLRLLEALVLGLIELDAEAEGDVLEDGELETLDDGLLLSELDGDLEDEGDSELDGEPAINRVWKSAVVDPPVLI